MSKNWYYVEKKLWRKIHRNVLIFTILMELILSFPVVLPFLNLYLPHFFVCLFTSVQDDLASEDVMILDTGHEVLMAIIGSFLQFEI